ncbi:MAG: hypothetical protein Q8Q31_04170 [Nanoarchaeota archaeon]|nr:hypothetical protein [Nanoarchaeota archaeon]
MQKDLINFIENNDLSPFNKTKTVLKNQKASLLKTKEAQAVYNKLLSKLSENFAFADTSNLWNFFAFTESREEIKNRQRFFASINKNLKNNFLKEISFPKKSWKPEYSILAVTEDEDTLLKLKEIDCPVMFIVSQYDIQSLKDYDVIQTINCENSSHVLEKLPQTIFIDSIEDIYLERYLETLSGWQPIVEILEKEEGDDEIRKIIDELKPLFYLINPKSSKTLSREEAESEIERLNSIIFAKLKSMTLTGDLLVNVLNKGELPQELKNVIKETLIESILPDEVINLSLPLSLDDKALDEIIRSQSLNKFSSAAEKIKKNSEEIKKIPNKLKQLSSRLLILDFLGGLAKYLSINPEFPDLSDHLYLAESVNLLIENPKPITFNLNRDQKCSILTGANSGGKTTLLEHIIQIIILTHLGLPAAGKTEVPQFSEIYYFAKNKGSANKGAFETLLTQMSEIKPGDKTLILADEIESVTEPGVAGKIISATAEYFLKKNCFLVIATHLGREVQKNLPSSARIDGIEAKGLNEFNELVVDHNPVLGKLANSTPELIIEKMFRTYNTEYFSHLQQSVKKSD